MAPPKATWNGKDSQGNPLRWNSPSLTWDGDIPQPTTLPKRMPILHILIGFDGMKDHDIEELAGAVSASLYTSAAYPAPPVTKADLDAALAAFSAAIPAAKQGGPADTADKNNKRATLIGLLRQLAAYAQSKHGNNLATLLGSGFQAASTNRAQSALAAPIISGIRNGTASQLLPQINSIPNASGYEPRYALIAADGTQGPWVMGEFAASTRLLAISNLTPGAIYAVQVRAQGGTDSHSDWSDTVQHRAM